MKVLKSVWKKWLRLAEIIGNFQMLVLLSILYWTLLLIIAIPFKLLSDSLSIRKSAKPRWITREPIDQVMAYMRDQG